MLPLPSSYPSSSRPRNYVETKREKLIGRLDREITERREDGVRHLSDSISTLAAAAHALATRPDSVGLYKLKLYPLSLERSAILNQLALEEENALVGIQLAYDEEREHVEEEWARGRDRIREKLLEGIEERRRKARDDKEGEGIIGDSSLDSQSRPHITRKLRNKLGSPPPTPNPAPLVTLSNPHSLNIDELPSSFSLPLISSSNRAVVVTTTTVAPNGVGGPGGARRKPKGAGLHPSQMMGGLGKSIAMLTQAKEAEIENDLGDIRRGSKRRRVATGTTRE